MPVGIPKRRTAPPVGRVFLHGRGWNRGGQEGEEAAKRPVPALYRRHGCGKIFLILQKDGEWGMEKNVLNDLVEKTKALIDAPTCSKEAGEAARQWLAAVGTDAENAATRQYLDELEADIMPIDNLIGFAESEKGAAYFGADTAAGIAAHAREIKKAGARYCDCPACAIAEAILERKQEILS